MHATIWMNLENIKWNKPDTKDKYLNDSTYMMGKFIEAENRGYQGLERGNGIIVNGYRGFVWGDERKL